MDRRFHGGSVLPVLLGLFSCGAPEASPPAEDLVALAMPTPSAEDVDSPAMVAEDTHALAQQAAEQLARLDAIQQALEARVAQDSRRRRREATPPPAPLAVELDVAASPAP